MPAYSGLRVAQLRELCEERNIDHGGLTKFLKALCAFDSDERKKKKKKKMAGLS